MDITTPLGMVMAGAVILIGQALEGGHAGSLIQLTAFLIVGGGTFGAIVVANPVSILKTGVKMGLLSIKNTPNDGAIQVETKEVDDHVIFAVKDNGPGVPAEDREHLFEKFYRGQAHQSATKGTGLGLYLVKYFIELHGGEVFLESDVGKGTKVGFTLPLQA